MHRQVVAFSTLAIEQTPAAPGFAQRRNLAPAAASYAPANEQAAGGREAVAVTITPTVMV
jgi:hypothetical protein